MNRSRAWFDSAARETGHRADTLEKVVRLGELAGEVARHPLLGSVLALKGGTALNLCFGPPRRLSVDLDFNFVGSEDRDEMLERRPLVEKVVGVSGAWPRVPTPVVSGGTRGQEGVSSLHLECECR